MNEDKASDPLRLSIRALIGNGADGASIRNIITDIYPDGALCFVLENRALYQLDKQSTDTADNNTILLPNGGPGRWLILAQGPGAESLVEIVGTDTNNVPSSADANFLGFDSSAFAFQPAGTPAGYTLTDLGGILTYNGAVSVRALVRFDGSVFIGAGGGGGGGGLAPGAVDLRTAGNYTILAKTGITNVPTSAITGDMGVSPITHTAITGFSLVLDGGGQFSTSAQVTGKVFAADYAAPTPATLTQAVLDMQAAYTDAATRPADFTNVGAGNIGGMTLTPGVYHWTTGVTIPTSVTLSGGPTDVFILQVTGVLSMTAAQSVILSGGVRPENVFWQVSGNVSIGATATFNGIILCQTNIGLVHGATMNGRLLAQTAVNLDDNIITAPSAPSGGQVWGAIALNGDIIGTDPTTSFLPGTETTMADGADLPQFISSERLLVLAPGDTVQAALATDAGADITASRVTLTVLLA
jgi:hypothetical protein